ncbi:MAG: DUF3576 domain-containing protein [Alphaproteobacteria bacterium]|nr:DUF3576 domain-containing protein [Alphaproteobacteria bacterium]
MKNISLFVGILTACSFLSACGVQTNRSYPEKYGKKYVQNSHYTQEMRDDKIFGNKGLVFDINAEELLKKNENYKPEKAQADNKNIEEISENKVLVDNSNLWNKALSVMMDYPLDITDKESGYISSEWIKKSQTEQMKINVILQPKLKVSVVLRNKTKNGDFENIGNDNVLANKIKTSIEKE